MDFECNLQQRSNKLSLKLKCLKSLRKGFNKNKVPSNKFDVKTLSYISSPQPSKEDTFLGKMLPTSK